MSSNNMVSKRLSNMKFMKQQEEREHRKLLENDKKRTLAACKWILYPNKVIKKEKKENQDIVSKKELERILVARRSYQQFNPILDIVVDNIKKELNPLLIINDEQTNDTISDEELIKRHAIYVKKNGEINMSRKRKKSRKHSKKNSKKKKN